MASDRSRRTDGLRDGYTGVVAQQGRVTLDRDFNAEHGFLAGRTEAEARDVIGPCGTPDDGFAISIPQSSPPGPPLWSPPPPLSPPAPYPFDFLIGPGTMYVGGQRAVFPGRPSGHPVTYSYYDQPDWIPRHDPRLLRELAAGRGRELVFLALAEQEIGAVEDPDLLEVALGGPDTTQRLRLLRRVMRQPVKSDDCAGAWAEAVALWRDRDGLVLDPDAMRLRPQVRLRVGFAEAGDRPDPCDPIAQGGYLGAENQTIRVQIADPGGHASPGEAARLLWGYDNASFMYRAVPLASNPAMLTISPPPPDGFHLPQAGQVVEILRTAAVLASEPDMSDPGGQRTIVRAVAELAGAVRRLTQPYGPANPGDPISYIVLDEPLPAEFLDDSTPLFMRVWQSEIAFDPAGDTVLLTDDVTGASTGVEVTFSLPPGGVLARGVYWLLAVRPETPQAVYPERLLREPQPPDGPRLWACPLAIIDWSGDRQTPQVTDCRNQFDNLVELSRRRAGCCTVAVSPRDLAAGIDLQSVLDRAARTEQGATLCLAPGRYPLAAPLRLSSAHSGLTIECCGGNAILMAAPGRADAFADGIVVLAGARGVTLRGLHFVPALAPLSEITGRVLADLSSGRVAPALVRRILADMRAAIGVQAVDSPSLLLQDCILEFARTADGGVPGIFGAGLMLRGNCSALAVRDCSFRSRIAPSFNRLAEPRPQLGLGTERLGTAVSSPPLVVSGDFEARMLDVARTSFETIATRTADIQPAAASNVLIVTVGCLAIPAIVAGDGPVPVLAARAGSLPCLLGDAELRGNDFTDLTLPLYAVASPKMLRIEDNSTAQCIGGFWLQVAGWLPPHDPKAAELFTNTWQQTENFAERFLLDALGAAYPLPQGAAARSAPLADPGPASVFVTGNQVEPVPVSRSGTTALLILANRPAGGATDTGDTSVSLIVANNRLRSRSGPQSPTVLLLLPEQERCAITGNLILSEPGRGADPGPSLWLVPDSINRGTSLLSVVGNVISGRSDLGSLPRTGVTPPQTWVTYNAMPS